MSVVKDSGAFHFAEHNGFLLVFEGADNVGKGTVLDEVVDWLDRKWLPRICFLRPDICHLMPKYSFVGREPTDNYRQEIGQVPQTNWLRQLYLFIRQREEMHRPGGCLHEAVKEHHHLAVMDRGYHSSCVYQGVLSGQTNRSILMAHGPWLFQPNLTVILDVSPKTVKNRIFGREKEAGLYATFDQNDIFQEAVRMRYQNLSSESDFKECVVVPNNGNLEETIATIICLVKGSLNRWVEVNFPEPC